MFGYNTLIFSTVEDIEVQTVELAFVSLHLVKNEVDTPPTNLCIIIVVYKSEI